MATSTVENYLKAILHLQNNDGGRTTVGEIAKELAVTPGTVTTMMRGLDEKGLIEYVPRQGLSLSATGREAAMQVVRRHRLIELFLVDVMKLDWSEVHEEAEVLEHVISDRLLDRIDEMLDHPTRDPHGDPIPDREGRVPPQESESLSEVKAGPYRIVRVSDGDSSLLEWLLEKGITIGEEITLGATGHAVGVSELSLASGATVQIGREACDQIFVESLS